MQGRGVSRIRQRSVQLPWLLTWVFSLLPALGATSCGRAHVKGTVAVDSILKAWQADGFDTEAVMSLEPDVWSAGACSRGLVSGLEVLLCEFAADESLAAGEEKIMSDWGAESVPTGAVVRTSRTILAISDRTKADPQGRTLARLAKVFGPQR